MVTFQLRCVLSVTPVSSRFCAARLKHDLKEAGALTGRKHCVLTIPGVLGP